MASLQGLLQRWGFVQLRRYGLELTPDGRILSTRPAILDDGTGGRIVGWRDGDVAIWKFSAWKGEPPAVPAAAPAAVQQPVARAARAVVPPVQAVAAVAATSPVITMPSPAAPAPIQASAAVMPVEVAGEPPVDEDDWEWTIALARARTAVDEAEMARPPEPASRSSRAQLSAPWPAERLTPLPISAMTDPGAASGEWPKTDLIGAIDYDSGSRVSTRPAVMIPRSVSSAPDAPESARTTAPRTVIPVPALPSMATMATTGCSRMEPVVRSSATTPASASRAAKGTGPVDPPIAPRHAVLVEDTIPNLRVGDRTRPGIAMPPSATVGERTRPGIALPPAARAVELPSIKRRMSPR